MVYDLRISLRVYVMMLVDLANLDSVVSTKHRHELRPSRLEPNERTHEPIFDPFLDPDRLKVVADPPARGHECELRFQLNAALGQCRIIGDAVRYTILVNPLQDDGYTICSSRRR